MLNQRKRAGRLRLLIAALVVTSISVVGAVGTASATPTTEHNPRPSRGVLEICKEATGDVMFSGSFGFKVQGVNRIIQVPVGYCSLPIKLNPGTVTVTEVQHPGYSVASIAAVGPTNDNRLVDSDLGTGTAKVQIFAGGAGNQTMVTLPTR